MKRFRLTLQWNGIPFLAVLMTSQMVLSQTSGKFWIFFKDKGQAVLYKENGLEQGTELGITQRAMERRGKVRSAENVIDAADLPVAPAYIQALENRGLVVQAVSRWLNGVTAEVPSSLKDDVLGLPFVKEMRSVATFIRRPLPPALQKEGYPQTPLESHTLDYGTSFMQNSLIRVPEVHDLGLSGRGILVGIIDTGFDWRDRSVFSHLDVFAERDFHWRDNNTADEDDDRSGQHNHGTEVLSVLGGFREGRLIGPAYGASYALAKTEWVPTTDLAIEEDHWIEAIEWFERMGVDVVSSSVGYATFVDKPDYTEDQLDGNTALITRAADLAAGMGVVVVESAGNRDFWDKINFPADGDSVIAVGAVNSEGNLASFSSQGPTVDGRIKPDVVAMGVSVYSVDPDVKITESYGFVGGTSYSCPLAAGVCALILEAHPELGPMDVRDALRETADRAQAPDTLYGWGLIDAYEAIFYHGPIFTDFSRVSTTEGMEHLEADILSKTGIEPDSVYLSYCSDDTEDFQTLQMYPMVASELIRFRGSFPSSLTNENIMFYITMTDTQGIVHTGPLGAPDVLYSLTDSQAEIVFPEEHLPERFQLYQNYPNPFNARTTIVFDLPERSRINLRIYNILGQEIAILIDDWLDAGTKEVVWDGMDCFGRRTASGIYLLRLEMGGQSQVRKMILVY
jgi:serine protease AprX